MLTKRVITFFAFILLVLSLASGALISFAQDDQGIISVNNITEVAQVALLEGHTLSGQ